MVLSSILHHCTSYSLVICPNPKCNCTNSNSNNNKIHHPSHPADQVKNTEKFLSFTIIFNYVSTANSIRLC